MSASNARSTSLPASVAITVAILAGSPENLVRPELRPGQRRWWIQRTDGSDRPWLDAGKVSGAEPHTFTIDLVPGGKYLVGTGSETRIRFVCPDSTCTVNVDPISGKSSVSTGKPALSVVPNMGWAPGEAPAFHVKGAPMGSEARGVTFESTEAAFAALSRMVQGGTVDVQHVASGLVAVTRGSWPVASYPPPVLPSVSAALASVPAPVAPAPDPVVVPNGDSWTRYADASVPHVAPAPAPEGFTWDTRAETVSSEAVARITEDDRYLRSIGLVMPPPVRTLGGVVNSIGRENIARSHAEWKAEPRTIDTLVEIRRLVESEAREDVSVRLGSLRMDQDGGLLPGMSAPGQRIVPEETALRNLCSLYPRTLPRSGDVMSVLPPAIRAHVWNDGAGPERDEDTVILRTRSDGGSGRSAYAVVSTGYGACDADTVAQWTETALRKVQGGTEARGAAEYDPQSTRLTVDAVWHADRVSNFAAGDVFKMGVRVTSADNGTGAIRVSLVAFRNLCYNLIITSETEANMARIVHRGTADDMVSRLVKGIEHVTNGAAPFLRRWGHLRQAPIASLLENPSSDVKVNVRAVVAALVPSKVDALDLDLPHMRRGALPAGVSFASVDRDSVVEALLSSWGEEPGETQADIVNAVTRLHEKNVPVAVLAHAERTAGVLVDAWGVARP